MQCRSSGNTRKAKAQAPKIDLPSYANRWAAMKPKVLAVARYIDHNHPKLADLAGSMRNCASTFSVNRHASGVNKLSKASLCKAYFLCPLCASIRSYRHRQQFMRLIEGALAEYPDAHLEFVTLTIKKSGNPIRDLGRLKAALEKLWLRRRRRSSEMAKVLGTITSLEFNYRSRSKDESSWHRLTANAHSIWLVGEEVNSNRLRREWAEVSHGSFDVDVRPIKGTKDRECWMCEHIGRVCRYCLKFADIPLGLKLRLYERLKGDKRNFPRMLNKTGVFHSPTFDLPKDPDPGPVVAEASFWYAKGGYVRCH